MISLTGAVRIFLHRGVTDLRKSFDGLAGLVRQHFDVDVFSGSLFIFANRRRSMIRVLYWDTDGFCLWSKRLEEGSFRIPDAQSEQVELSRAEFSMLLEGIMALYLAATLMDAIRLGVWAWVPFIGLFLWGHAYMALAGLGQARRASLPTSRR